MSVSYLELDSCYRTLTRTSGGTNLRVGFIELLGKQPQQQDDLPPNSHHPHFAKSTDRIKRHLEKSWPIADHLKNENEDGLFLWIGQCIA